MKKPKGLMRARSIAFVVLTLFLLFLIQNAVKGSTLFYLPVQMPADVNTPLVTLQNMTPNSTIYTNGTSARITVADNTTALDVLEILNQTDDTWQLQLLVYNDTNVSRLANCTIWFHNGSTSVQIRITDGTYSQMSGELCNLVNSKIAITATTITQGASYIYTFLKILHPETSTYFLYVITFEIAS